MAIHEYPYTDFHEMNLDWIIREMKKLVDDWASFASDVTASAHESADPEVTVTGDLKTGIDFDFGLVRGLQGPEGPIGPQGEGLDILGVYDTLSDLQTAHPTGTPGDVYLVGSGGSYNIYVWSEDDSDWKDGGPITSPSPSSNYPLMDGSASAGTSLLYSRDDHVHPSDITKQDTLVSGTNIKTINGETLLGSTDIAVQVPLVSGTNIKTINGETLLGSTDITVQETLVSGTNIKTINSESLLGSTDIAVQVPLVSGTNIKTINSESLLGSTDIAVQVPLVSGTNIKTINNESILGSGDLTVDVKLTQYLLWENASPTSAFAPQNLYSIDISPYQYLIVYAANGTGAGTYYFNVWLENVPGDHLVELVLSSIKYRDFVINSNGLTIGQGNIVNTYGSSATADNTWIIPIQIFGVKVNTVDLS